MVQIKNKLLGLLVIILLLLGCSPDDIKNTETDIITQVEVSNPYILVLGTDNNSYVFPNVTGFDSGTFNSSAESFKSIQMKGDRRIHFYEEDYMYSFAYNQDSPGKSLSFEIVNNVFKPRKEFDVSNGIQARTNFDQSIIGTYSDREYSLSQLNSGEIPQTYIKFFKFDVLGDLLHQPVKFHSYDFDNTQEVAYITDLRRYNQYLLAGVRTMKAYLEPGVFPEPILLFETDFSNRTYLGVFDESYNLVKIIKDTLRTGMIGGLVKATGKTGVEVLDNGEVYAFASAFSSKDRPSGVLKVNTSNLEFDETYFFNINQASGDRKLYRVHYLGGTKFCLQLFKKTGLDVKEYYDAPGAASVFAVFDVATGDFDVLNGEPQNVKSITDPYIDKENQKIYFGINRKDASPAVYVIDAQAKTIAKGLSIEGQEVRALGKLSIN